MENATRSPYAGFSPKSVCNVIGRTGSIEVDGRTLHFKIVAQEEFAIQDGEHGWHIPLVHNGRSQIGDFWKDGRWCDGLGWDKDEMDASRESRPYINPGWVAPWMGRADNLFGILLRMLFQVVNAELDKQGIRYQDSSYEDDFIFEKDGQVFISEWLSKQTKEEEEGLCEAKSLAGSRLGSAVSGVMAKLSEGMHTVIYGVRNGQIQCTKSQWKAGNFYVSIYTNTWPSPKVYALLTLDDMRGLDSEATTRYIFERLLHSTLPETGRPASQKLKDLRFATLKERLSIEALDRVRDTVTAWVAANPDLNTVHPCPTCGQVVPASP